MFHPKWGRYLHHVTLRAIGASGSVFEDDYQHFESYTEFFKCREAATAEQEKNTQDDLELSACLKHKIHQSIKIQF